MIDRATVQRIIDAADIVEVVSDYVHLTRRGANYMGLCPFHNERTPSFAVNRKRNSCYCFSCHKGGSPVNFIMEKEGLSYREALLHLANKYGIKVEEREMTDEERARQNRRDSMLTANQWAMQLMERNLLDSEDGRDIGLQYLYQRGVTEEAVKAFHLGYSSDNGQWLATEATKAGYDAEILKELGLLGTSQQGRTYDRFRGRVMFPVMNSAGKVIAFGGRDLKGGPAKYINSPESDLYRKSNELYGIYQARNEITRQDCCYLVEGYLDVIGMWQAGLKNVVASSGTALTDGQIALIHRFTKNITLIYDGDNAGIHAALRGMDMLLRHDMQVKLVLLPDGHDPDSFAKANSSEDFRKYIAEHETDIIRFKARTMMQDADRDPQKRSAAIRSIVDTIACINDPIERNVYVQECSAMMGMKEDLLMSETAKARRKLVESWTQERAKRDYPDSKPQEAHVDPIKVPGETANQPADKLNAKSGNISIEAFEREVMRYCVRYGMLEFCESVDLDGNVLMLNVADYIGQEMELDAIKFETPVYAKLYDRIVELKDDFARARDQEWAKISEASEQKKQVGIEEIAAKDLTLAEIEKAEAKLNEKVNEEANAELLEFSKNFIGRMLSYDADDEIRAAVMGLVTEKYQLSKYHSKLQRLTSEWERITELLPRAIIEWKSGILDLSIKELNDKIRVCSDPQAMLEYMKELNEMIELRKQAAKEIGERIITPNQKP